MASATLILSSKKRYPDGAILEVRLWTVPVAVRGSSHFVKYSLFYGYPGRRLIAYDNEAGKGDHVHRGATEAPYRFVSVEKLVSDFLDEVRAMRGGSI